MKYQILYRLHRAGFMPGMSMQEIDARNQRELDEALALIHQKWGTRGFQVNILEINKRPPLRTRGLSRQNQQP